MRSEGVTMIRPSWTVTSTSSPTAMLASSMSLRETRIPWLLPHFCTLATMIRLLRRMEVHTRLAMARKPEQSGAPPQARARAAVPTPIASFAGRLARSGGDRRPLYGQIVRRTLLLFALGLFLAWFPFYTVDWSTARIPGVLQRIAVVYLVAALAWLHLGPRSRALLMLALLAGYWLAMVLVPVPGHGAGDLSPDGNLAAWIDHLVLGHHTWKKAPGPGDPEGILSTVPAIATALAGLFAGDGLRSPRAQRGKLAGLLLWGGEATVAGLAL